MFTLFVSVLLVFLVSQSSGAPGVGISSIDCEGVAGARLQKYIIKDDLDNVKNFLTDNWICNDYVFQSGHKGYTPFSLAARHNSIRCVRGYFLLKNALFRVNATHGNAMEEAIMSGGQVIEEIGAKYDAWKAPFQSGKYPIQLLTEKTTIDNGMYYNMLVMYTNPELDIDFKVLSADGSTLLHTAVSVNNAPAFRVAIRKKVNPSIVNKNGDSLLHIGAKSAGQYVLMELQVLIEKSKFNLNARNNAGYTPLYIAAKNNPPAFYLLLNVGASIRVQPLIDTLMNETSVDKDVKEYYRNWKLFVEDCKELLFNQTEWKGDDVAQNPLYQKVVANDTEAIAMIMKLKENRKVALNNPGEANPNFLINILDYCVKKEEEHKGMSLMIILIIAGAAFVVVFVLVYLQRRGFFSGIRAVTTKIHTYQAQSHY